MPVTYRPSYPWNGRDDPEDGLDAKRIHHLISDDGERGILGFACDAGVIRNKGRTGAAQGPASMRKALANMAAPVDARTIIDLGDVVVDGDCLEDGQGALAMRIAGALGYVERVVVMGGGHETAFASYQGLRQANPEAQIGIINLDAHLDLRLVGENGPSSGTPFTQIRELAPDRFDYLCLGVAEEANTLALFQRAEDWGVETVSDHALISKPTSADPAIEAMASRSDLIYLTVDLDLLPAYQCPGVSAPAARGVPFQIVERLIDQVLIACERHRCPIPLADIVELSPPHDRDSISARAAALLARQLLCL